MLLLLLRWFHRCRFRPNFNFDALDRRSHRHTHIQGHILHVPRDDAVHFRVVAARVNLHPCLLQSC